MNKQEDEMYPITTNIRSNQFIDLEGFFTFREKECFNYHLSPNLKYGRFSKFKGYQIKLCRINKFHYGQLIEYHKTYRKSSKHINPIQKEEIEIWSKEFFNRKHKTLDRQSMGQKYFQKIHNRNPLFFSKDKIWIKKYEPNCNTSVGKYFFVKLDNEVGILKHFNGIESVIIVTYNKSFKHGFMILPLID